MGTEQLNHPVVVIAILAGLAVFLREVSWFVRSLQGKNPTDELRTSIERFTEALQNFTTAMARLHDKTERIERLCERIDDRVTGVRQ